MQRAQLADFLRSRRAALRPDDVGLRPGVGQRRTPGLRRDEVALLSGISTDYYTRLEQRRGPVPSGQVLASMARALRLSDGEREYLFELAGRAAPPRTESPDEVAPGMRRVLDRLGDVPAMVSDPVGRTLLQTPAARALLGGESRYTGAARSRAYRWFTDPDARLRTPAADHDRHSRNLVTGLAAATAAAGPRSTAAALVSELRRRSAEFAAIWATHPVADAVCPPMRILHPELGVVDVRGDNLFDPDRSQVLTIFTVEPRSNSEEKVRLLTV
ncbi:XRE family transcriptional regulator [Jiangella aurantiaca]|uniref:XRE family transcriptional regulator n=1 Tax=Jiangella aurantiaca TaxID=2530373 RepID=A0A4R5A1L6_9ACTN|nr:helix-turn-helix transcriptional regulator [Jiangella aurantiaca]TDD65758.1 XRE family transcriptional regulator [Jiangella aurantiaca]